jgi:hypothetical protein
MERDKSGSSRGLSIVLEGRTASVSASKGPIIRICELDSVSKWLSHIQLWQMKDMTYIIAIMAGLFLYHCCPCSPQFKHFHSIVSACSSLFFPASLLFLLFGVLWLFCRWSTALPPRQIESPKFFKGWWNWGDSSCSTFWHRLVTLSTFLAVEHVGRIDALLFVMWHHGQVPRIAVHARVWLTVAMTELDCAYHLLCFSYPEIWGEKLSKKVAM